MATSKRKRQRSATPKVPQVSEAAFQAAVLDLALTCHWKCYHVYDSRRSGPHKGFPDWVFTRPPVFMVRELKRQDRDESDDQRAWRADLIASGVDARVWRMSDWAEIEATLR